MLYTFLTTCSNTGKPAEAAKSRIMMKISFLNDAGFSEGEPVFSRPLL
jgi:hypothetical protein